MASGISLDLILTSRRDRREQGSSRLESRVCSGSRRSSVRVRVSGWGMGRGEAREGEGKREKKRAAAAVRVTAAGFRTAEQRRRRRRSWGCCCLRGSEGLRGVLREIRVLGRRGF